nr:MAG TPA: hypothetical protein [Caudoviricetes sp.]
MYSWVRRHDNTLQLQPLPWIIGTTTNSWLILTLEVRSSTDPSDGSGITGMPTLPHQQRCSAI